MAKAERLSEKGTIRFKGNCEILRTIFNAFQTIFSFSSSSIFHTKRSILRFFTELCYLSQVYVDFGGLKSKDIKTSLCSSVE